MSAAPAGAPPLIPGNATPSPSSPLPLGTQPSATHPVLSQHALSPTVPPPPPPVVPLAAPSPAVIISPLAPSNPTPAPTLLSPNSPPFSPPPNLSPSPPHAPNSLAPSIPSPPPPPYSAVNSPPSHRNLAAPPPPSNGIALSSSSSSSSLPPAAVIGIAAGVGLITIIFLLMLIWCCLKKKTRKAYGTGGQGALHQGPVGNSRSWFTYDELNIATNGFVASNLLGEGGFGRVYRGHLPNGQVVAVKQLTVGGGQGDREFRAEVEIISRIHHRHLVSLVGYCIADNQRLLVYDFVPNGTLDDNLHGKKQGVVMDWATRVKVAVGAARGLAYLHEDCNPRIIHRDIKASNILLDKNFEAQVADFGLAKLASDANTHVTTRVMGTFGYLAPEYAASGKLTEKSDVFSFGVVLLELITGRKPVDLRQPIGNESLVEWARPLMTVMLEDGNVEQLVDPELRNNYDVKEMICMIEAAAACVRHSASKRPKMAQVIRALESDTDIAALYQGSKPGHSVEHNFVFGGSHFAGGSSDYDTQQYNADMQKLHKIALNNQKLGS
ncbi:unnamed protein product, partial [Sphagnum troendelagicum]